MKTVLIVDDSAAEQFFIKKVVQKFDPSLETLTATDGEEALQVLEQHAGAVDLILLDLNMPRMNGHEFLEEYSKRDGKGPVVVLVTSSQYSEDRTRAEAYSCVLDYKHKPLSVEDLVGIKEKIANRKV